MKKYLIPAVSAVLMLTSCMGAFIKNTSVKSGSLPADFGKGNTTVLVVKEGNKADEVLEKYFPEYYKGKYVFISKDEQAKIDHSQYADKDQYPYLFYREKGDAQVTTVDVYSTGTRTVPIRYYLVDRRDQKKYRSKVSSSLYSRILKGYLINMEKTRQLNN